MMFALVVLACAALYALKGGQHQPLVEKFKDRAEERGKWTGYIADFVTDGTYLSTLGYGLLTWDPLAALGWLIGIKPSLGEEIGDIGGYRGNWYRNEAGDIVPYHFEKAAAAFKSGVKRGLQRGVFFGAMLALFTGDVVFIPAGATFPLISWIGVSIGQLIGRSHNAGWRWYEWLYGAVIGVATALYMGV